VLPLFARLTARSERAELVRFVARLSEQQTDSGGALKAVSHICTSLNAMDRKRVEEPDFEVRMRTYLSLREQAATSTSSPLSCLELSALVYNCCYSLRHEQDTSLKTNALETLQAASRAIGSLVATSTQPEDGRKLVSKVCVSCLKQWFQF